MFSDHGENGGNRQSNGSVSRGRRDWKFGARHGNGNRRPGRDGRGAVRTGVVLLGEDDTSGRRGEQNEKPDIEEDRNERPNELSDKLVPWLGAEEITRLEIAGHVRSLGSRSSGNDTSGQVEGLCSAQTHTRRFSDATEDELGGLGDCRDGVDVGLTGTLDTNEGEEETEDESEDSLSNVEVEQGGKDGNRNYCTDEQSTGPPQSRDAVLHRSLIFIFWV